jgi:hypothetical protein
VDESDVCAEPTKTSIQAANLRARGRPRAKTAQFIAHTRVHDSENFTFCEKRHLDSLTHCLAIDLSTSQPWVVRRDALSRLNSLQFFAWREHRYQAPGRLFVFLTVKICMTELKLKDIYCSKFGLTQVRPVWLSRY